MEQIMFSADSVRDLKQIGGMRENGDYSDIAAYKGSRSVWLIEYNDTAAVVKREFRGRDNKREAEVWDAVNGTDLAKYFAPVLAHTDDFEYIMMERAVSVLCDMGVRQDYDLPRYYGFEDETITEQYNDFCDEIEMVCRSHGIEASDLHPGNVAIMSDGRMAMIDYGFFDLNNNRRRTWCAGSCTECQMRES